MKFAVHLLVACALASGTLWADSVTLSSGTSWSSFSSVFNSGQASPVTGVQGTPFWNNWSGDTSADLGCSMNCTHDMNIGYMLTDSGGWAQTGTPAVLGSDSVANAALGCSGADPNCMNGDPTSVGFNVTGNSYDVRVLGAYSSGDTGPEGTVFGWYTMVGGTPVLHPLYSSVGYVTTPGGWNPFSTGLGIGGQYGFYATVCYNVSVQNCTGFTETFFTDASLDNGVLTAANYNHFALFNLNSASDNYVIAFKDGAGASGPEAMGDYQDLVIELADPSSFAVPEPATFALMGAGLAALALARRRAAKR